MNKEIWTIEYKENNSNESYEVIRHGKIEIYFKDLIALLHAIQTCFAYSNGKVDKIIVKGLNKNDYSNYLNDYKDVIEWKN